MSLEYLALRRLGSGLVTPEGPRGCTLSIWLRIVNLMETAA